MWWTITPRNFRAFECLPPITSLEDGGSSVFTVFAIDKAERTGRGANQELAEIKAFLDQFTLIKL